MKVILKHKTNEQQKNTQTKASKQNKHTKLPLKQTTLPKSCFFKFFPEKNFPKCSRHNVQV